MKYILGIATLLASANLAYADCTGDIAAIMETHKAAGPYHVSSTSNMGGQTMKNEIDVILPSSFHMKSDKMEAVITKKGAWMKMGGKWQAMPGQVSGMMTANIQQGMAQGPKNLKNAQCLGTQDYEGGSYTAYSFDSSGQAMGIKATSHVTMYVDGDKHPVWVLVDGTAMGHKSSTIQKITFDPTITITAPK